MNDYNKEEWRRMIEQYNQKMMEQYGNRIQKDLPHETVVTTETVELALESSNSVSELTDIGQLQIRVSTENQAIPIGGAVVTVTHTNNGSAVTDHVLITDQSGLTEIVNLPTKDRVLSLSPDNPDPFTTYNIAVTADGYFTKEFINLPIYGGVTAIQSVSMIPLPEGGDSDLPIVRDGASNQ